MPTPTVYVLCDCHNTYEGMTKEQIFAAIAEATGNTPTDVDAAFITKIKEMNANSELKFWVGTTAQFNAIVTKAADTFYILTDDDTADDLDSIATALQGIIDGATTVPNANHATTADSATTATNATNAINTAFTNGEWSNGLSSQLFIAAAGTYQAYAIISQRPHNFGLIESIGGNNFSISATVGSTAAGAYQLRIMSLEYGTEAERGRVELYVDYGNGWAEDTTAPIYIRKIN